MADFSSIWAGTSKPAVALQDPTEQLNKLIGTQRQVLGMRNDLAQQARGEALQQATDPNTGQVNMLAATGYMAADPRAAFAMPDAVNQQQSADTSQNTLSQSRNNYMGQMFGSLNKLPDDQIHDGAASAIGDAVSQGLLDQSTGMRMLARMPTDPAGARLHLQQLQIGAMAPGAGREAIYGTPGTINTGGTIQSGVVGPADGPNGGVFRPAGSTPMTMTPGDVNTPVKIGTDAQGRDIMGTKGQFVNRATGGAPAPTGAFPMGDGRFPAALRNPNRPDGAPAITPAPATAPAPVPQPSYTSAAAGSGPGQPAAPAPGVVPGGGIAMGPGVAQQAAMTQQGGDSAKAFQGISDQGVQARSQGAVLGTMLADTQNFTPGQSWNDWSKTYFKNAPNFAPSFGMTPDKVAAMESFDKFANQLAGQQGAGSDARLAVAQGGNPSSKMSPGGVDLVLRQLQGNADYLGARAALAAKHPDQADVRGFEATTGAQLDPRAFQVNRMTPAQRQTYDRSLSDADRAQVRASYNFAHGAGLFTAPAAAAASPSTPVVATPPRPQAATLPPMPMPASGGPGGALRGAPAPDPNANPLRGASRGY